MTSFAEKVKRLRKREKLTQSKLARMLKVESGTVSRWERGGPVDPGNVEKVEELLAKPPVAAQAGMSLVLRDGEGRLVELGEFRPTPELLRYANGNAAKVGHVKTG